METIYIDSDIAKTQESLYIIREYGIRAWYDLNAIHSYPEAQDILRKIVDTLLEIEQYEDIQFIKDILPLFNSRSVD